MSPANPQNTNKSRPILISSPCSSPPSIPAASPSNNIPTPPCPNPPTSSSEALYARLNTLRTTFLRQSRTRTALKRRIDAKLSSHADMFASREFSIDYQVALTASLNNFLDPLYDELERTEVACEELDAEISRVIGELVDVRKREERGNGGEWDVGVEKGKFMGEGMGGESRWDGDSEEEEDSEEEDSEEEDEEVTSYARNHISMQGKD
ncbi:hypothetical protein L873DRAFT_1793546 [Choiromyces venosus 120613-1]|uniref:Uncharacterized protein n=1 Tax=Choiromyces venosus 120613-1 TaxID=1336337 RepID=A0A3N4J5S1_9PEZI|nr:hypothetical protein L873DRAFT_1793546 [Choiromyces venosus 120613-1]